MGSLLINNRNLVRVIKAKNHLQSVREEKLMQQRKVIAEQLKATLECIESKIEVANYLIK